MKEKKIKKKFKDFECNLLINGINEWRHMLLAADYLTEDVDMLLLKLIKKHDPSVMPDSFILFIIVSFTQFPTLQTRIPRRFTRFYIDMNRSFFFVIFCSLYTPRLFQSYELREHFCIVCKSCHFHYRNLLYHFL